MSRAPQAGARPASSILAAARAEAEDARHGYVGVEHLLLALAQPAAPTQRLLSEHGITLQPAREAVRRVIDSGLGDGPRFDPATLLGTLGIDLDQIRREVERRFGPDALNRLYAGEVGWNLRPRGPLCELPPNGILKKAISSALGNCWVGPTPPRLHDRLLVAALDVGSAGLGAVLDELHVSVPALRTAVSAKLRLAS